MAIQLQGRYEDGNFILDKQVNILKPTRVTITFHDVEELPSDKTIAQHQNEAIRRFFAAIDSIEDEPITDEDLSLLENNRVNFYRELGV